LLSDTISPILVTRKFGKEETMDFDLLDELLGATRTNHLRFHGQGVLRGGLVRSTKILLSPRTGGLKNRLAAIIATFDTNKILLRLPKPRVLPPELVRLEPWEMEYLFAMARQAKLGIVETGRFLGGSTLVLAGGAPQIPIWSIDIAPQDDTSLKRLMRELSIGENIDLIVGDSTSENPSVGEFDLLWIDGDHSFEGCSGDIKRWWPRLSPGGSMILHDCYLGCEVLDAVSNFLTEVRDAEIVTGTVNTRAHFRSPTGSICHIRKLRVA
jgi:predicted O-methyltransferase YrrM